MKPPFVDTEGFAVAMLVLAFVLILIAYTLGVLK